MANRKNILIIDHNDSHYELVCKILKEAPGKPLLIRAVDVDRGIRLLRSRRFDLVLTENGQSNDSAWITDLKAAAKNAAIVVLTSRADEKKAVAAMKMGADDYIIKNRDCLKNLGQVLARAMESRKKKEESKKPPLSGINLLAHNFKVISEYINTPSKGIAEGKKRIRKLEQDLDHLKGMLKTMMS